MRVFISQPMNGLSDAEIENERKRAIEEVKIAYPDEDIYVIDNLFKDEPHIANPLWYLGESLKLLSTANLVFFSRGWKYTRGCKIEFVCAKAYGIKYMMAI